MAWPAGRALVVGLALACAACAPATSSLAWRSPLSIDVVWARPGPPPPALDPPARQAPAGVIVGWNPRDYDLRQVEAVANDECAAYDEDARAAGGPQPSPTGRVERFRCTRGAQRLMPPPLG